MKEKDRDDIIAQLWKIELSVDDNEWYYGRSENRTNANNRVLITGLVAENSTASTHFAKEINECFLWIQTHEKDSAKHKRRKFYADKGFFVNQSPVSSVF